MRAEAYVTAENLEERTQAWLQAGAGIVRPRPGWRLDVRRAALVVVDVQRAFCEEEGSHWLPAFAAIALRLDALVQAWREAGRPVAWTRHGHARTETDGTHGRFWGSVIFADSPDARFARTPQPGEWAACKNTYDAFFGTDLERFLREQSCTQIVAAGVLTHLCVETTVRAAFVRGFEPFVAVDACAANLRVFHENALLAMAAGFAGLVSVQEVIGTCRPRTC